MFNDVENFDYSDETNDEMFTRQLYYHSIGY